MEEVPFSQSAAFPAYMLEPRSPLLLFKDFHTFREESLGFRADFFNILNVADYGNPDNNIQDSSFGVINTVRNQERRIQLSLNYKF